MNASLARAGECDKLLGTAALKDSCVSLYVFFWYSWKFLFDDKYEYTGLDQRAPNSLNMETSENC